jgi:hypothetical protein
MTRFFLIAPLLLTACAAIGARPASPVAAAIPAVPQTFVCQASVRPSVYVKSTALEDIRLSQSGDRSVRSGAFRFRVLYNDDRYEGRSLITYVYSTATGKLIEETLFQLDRQKGPVNQFNGGHGFTGLHYVYAPDSAAELQYICSAG